MSTLYLVGTPIGNLEDITLRALRVLREVPLIAAEDTREARKLLSHYEISAHVVPFHAESPPAHLRRVLAGLRASDVAFIPDAGMPGISDPGAELARAALSAGHDVTPLPGASAVTLAVAGAALSDGGFVFAGFLPRRSGDRRRELTRLTALGLPVVAFEAPHRVRALLADVAAELPDAQLVIARELTKLYEQWQRGTAAELLDVVREQGEFTIVIQSSETTRTATVDESCIDELLGAALADSATLRDAVAQVVGATGASRRAVYTRALQLRAKGEAKS
jgi:16S rRNA (cytidine1402-2'-O)-methyltransferase